MIFLLKSCQESLAWRLVQSLELDSSYWSQNQYLAFAPSWMELQDFASMVAAGDWNLS
jgi:hypothetical protein